jgi:poly-gamma-glutamate synthesis protein (capsule biosynthesis protein)
MDQDMRGLKETLRALDDEKIVHVGTGLNLDEAWTPMFVEVRGIKIGFVGASFTSRNDQGLSRNDYVARIEDENRLSGAVAKARSSGAHFVVATMHAGEEHKFVPNARQKAFAKAAVKAGADLVIGAHPHVVQPAEKIDGKWVFYSLGNFIFDQGGPDQSEALAVELHLKRAEGEPKASIEKIRLHPIHIQDSAPKAADEEMAKRIFERVEVKGRELEP